jgi:hypothetical protein
MQPCLVERKRVQCDSQGIARFRTCTMSGGPARPGLYKIRSNVNMNQVHVRGVMVNGQITRRTFNGAMLVKEPVAPELVKWSRP